MHRAYVGFSTPVGYDYLNQASKVSNDNQSSPNPILVGVTGLTVLFDEIWFACRSLCPESMRKLEYVRFVDEKYPQLEFDIQRAHDVYRSLRYDVPISELHPKGYSHFIERYYGAGHPDNHTHGLNFLNHMLNGNPNFFSLVLDLIILDQLDEGYTLCLNGLTRKMTFPEGLDWIRDDQADEAIRLADRALTISSIYDITGPKGPYHPVLEELRGHEFVKSFRNWARGKHSSLHNRSTEAIVEELNGVTQDFEQNALRAAIGKGSLKETSIAVGEGFALDLVPGASTLKAALDAYHSTRSAPKNRLSAYVAESQGAMWRAHQNKRVHLY